MAILLQVKLTLMGRFGRVLKSQMMTHHLETLDFYMNLVFCFSEIGCWVLFETRIQFYEQAKLNWFKLQIMDGVLVIRTEK